MTDDAAPTMLPDSVFAGIDRAAPEPLWAQLARRIEAAIADGTVPAGARLETELALVERLGLSRPTVRRAFQEVVDRGLVVRRRGKGTQVVHGPVRRRVELTSLFDDLVRGRQAPTTRVLERRVVEATEDVADRLAVAAGSPVLRLRRLRLSDGVPLAVLENVLPREHLAVGDGDLESEGLYGLLRARGTSIRVAQQRIGARAATAEESRLLDVPDRAPLLTMDRVAFDTSGRPVESGTHCYRPDLYSFEVTLVDS